MLNIVIFGVLGFGKGIQSECIVEKFGINYILIGDVFCVEIKKGIELGKIVKGYIDQGQLLFDELIIDILVSMLDSFKESKGVIFDGFFRIIVQVEVLKKMLVECGQEVFVMLDLDVFEEELMICLIKCGQELGCVDDNEEIIKKCLVVYYLQMVLLIDWYKNEGKYQYIYGLGMMDVIFVDIVVVVEKLQ